MISEEQQKQIDAMTPEQYERFQAGMADLVAAQAAGISPEDHFARIEVERQQAALVARGVEKQRAANAARFGPKTMSPLRRWIAIALAVAAFSGWVAWQRTHPTRPSAMCKAIAAHEDAKHVAQALVDAGCEPDVNDPDSGGPSSP